MTECDPKMAEFNELYQRAQYYDIVFNRDVSGEVDFIINVFKQFHAGQTPTSLLDLACGPGYHARDFARRGLHAIGLDLRMEMLALAEESAVQERVHVDWIAADMRHLKLENPVDVAINVFDGIDCLLTNDDLIAHLNAIADNLTEDGLYLVDVTHPRFAALGHYAPFHYSGTRDGVAVDISWRGNTSYIDPLTSIASTEVEMRIQENGSEQCLVDTAQERFLTAQELTLLARCSGRLTPVAWYGDYDLNQPFDNSPGAIRMIAIFQKVQ